MTILAVEFTKPLRWYDHIFINSNWFALTLRSQVLAGLVVPLLVQQFVGEVQKGTYFGTIRLWALMLALLSQAIFGMLSDHSTLRWGRRRPFVLLGNLLEMVFIMSMAWIVGLQGMSGYVVLFTIYLCSMFSTNLSQGATQGLIPDIVPDAKRGITSGVKTLLEVPLPLVLFGLVIAPMIEKGNIIAGLSVTATVMLLCLGLTMLVREERPVATPRPLNWKPFLTLVLMTAVFTLIILILGQCVKLIVPFFESETPTLSTRLLFSLLGVAAMLAAVVAGVFASLRIQLGGEARKNNTFTWWVITRLSALVAINSIASFLLYFIQEKFNLPGKQAAGLAGTLPLVLGLCVILFSLLGGWLCDRFNRKWVTFASGIIGLLGVVIIVGLRSIAATYVAAAVFGLGYALFNVASWALGTDIIPKERAGEFFGLQNLAGAGAGAIGAYIGGPIADASGYVLLFVIFGVMFLLSSVAVLFVKVQKAASTPATG